MGHGNGHGGDNQGHDHAENKDRGDKHDNQDNLKDIRQALTDRKELKGAFEKDDPKAAEFLHKHFGDVQIVGAKEDSKGGVDLELDHVPKGWKHAHLDEDGRVEFENGNKIEKDGKVLFKDGTVIEADGRIHLANGDKIDSHGNIISKDGQELLASNPLEAAKQEATEAATSTYNASSASAETARATVLTSAQNAETSASSAQATGEVNLSTAGQVADAQSSVQRLIDQVSAANLAAGKGPDVPASLVLARDGLATAERNLQPALNIYERGAHKGVAGDVISYTEKHSNGLTTQGVENLLDGRDQAAA